MLNLGMYVVSPAVMVFVVRKQLKLKIQFYQQTIKFSREALASLI